MPLADLVSILRQDLADPEKTLFADEVLARVEEKLGIKAGETTADGAITLIEEQCLAACSEAPAAVCGKSYLLHLDTANLDEILELYIIGALGAAEIVAKGFDSDLVERIVTMVGRAEHKRRQAAPVIKVSARAFGMGRRMPIARAIYEARAGATLRRKP